MKLRSCCATVLAIGAVAALSGCVVAPVDAYGTGYAYPYGTTYAAPAAYPPVGYYADPLLVAPAYGSLNFGYSRYYGGGPRYGPPRFGGPGRSWGGPRPGGGGRPGGWGGRGGGGGGGGGGGRGR
ncbi:hypothetical protein AAFF27_12560 [Xylophilus sp. GW821-FHT01B05]